MPSPIMFQISLLMVLWICQIVKPLSLLPGNLSRLALQTFSLNRKVMWQTRKHQGHTALNDWLQHIQKAWPNAQACAGIAHPACPGIGSDQVSTLYQGWVGRHADRANACSWTATSPHLGQHKRLEKECLASKVEFVSSRREQALICTD